METTQIIGYSILPIFDDNISGKFPIKFDFERKESFGAKMNFYILSDRTCNNGKHNTAKRNQGNRATIESYIFEDKKYYRDKDSNLRKSSSNQCPTQLIHPPKNLERQLLDSCKHKTRRKN